MLASLQHTNEYHRDYYRPSHRFNYKNVQKSDPHYWHEPIIKTVESATKGTVNVAKDFWWDMHNDKVGYASSLIVGTVVGLLGGIPGGAFGAVAGGIFGLSFASAIHYTERRFIFNNDYKMKKEEWRKKEELKKGNRRKNNTQIRTND